jgi:hypothetical protein
VEWLKRESACLANMRPEFKPIPPKKKKKKKEKKPYYMNLPGKVGITNPLF